MLVLWSTIYDSLAEHAWVLEVLARRRMMAPSVLGAIEEIHAALRDAGLSIEAAVRAYRLMWNFTLGSLLVRAGAGSEGPSRQRELRGAPDPERYPMLAAAATAWTEADDRDTYLEDLEALIERCWRRVSSNGDRARPGGSSRRLAGAVSATAPASGGALRRR